MLWACLLLDGVDDTCIHINQIAHREACTNALVMGTKIRYVHLPDKINVAAVRTQAGSSTSDDRQTDR